MKHASFGLVWLLVLPPWYWGVMAPGQTAGG